MSIEKGSVRAWILACRPATLVASITPVLVGTAIAHVSGGVRAGPALAALLGAMLLQIASNLANDVFDFEKGADAHDRLGPPRAVQQGLLTRNTARVGVGVALGMALGTGVYLALVAGPGIIALGIAAMVSAVAYTAGPWPLGYHGLGEVFVLVFFGFAAVCGTVWVQIGSIPELAPWSAAAIGALATAILVVNNVRDRTSDLRAGKRTLAVRFGRRAGVAEYAVLLTVAYVIPVALFVAGTLGVGALLPLVTLPLAMKRVHEVATLDGRELNGTLVGTAKLLGAFGATLAIAIVIGARA